MIYSIQYIRALAAILVVMTHVRSSFDHGSVWPFDIDYKEVNIAFTFAAGFLFRHLAINESYSSFIRRRAQNVLVPYVILSIPAILVYVIGEKTHPHVDLSGFGPIELTAYLLFTGLHLGPFWFIPMIFIIYLSTPIIRMIDFIPRAYAPVLIITFVLSNTVFSRPEYNVDPVRGALHYLPVFVTGMACARYYSRLRIVAARFWKPAAVLAVLGLLSSGALPEAAQFGLKTMILFCGFLVAIHFEIRGRNVVVDTLARCSFPIFFLHGYFVGALREAADHGWVELYPSWPALIALTALICALCVGIWYAGRAVMGRRSRYLLGA